MKPFLIVLMTAVLTLGACGTSTPQIDTSGAVVIDVRTPAEYASGHLEGARNIDLESGAFQSQVARLDPDAKYVVYCHSGNRSAQAAAIMQAAGLSVTDAGGIDHASQATGLSIVQ